MAHKKAGGSSRNGRDSAGSDWASNDSAGNRSRQAASWSARKGLEFILAKMWG